MITSIPLPDFRPDQTVASGVLLVARNVYPAVDGYRPVQDVQTFTDALPDVFMGGYSAIASNGDAYLLAGTASSIEKYVSDGTWDELEGGLSITGRWRFAQFGDYVVSVNGSETREIDLLGLTADPIADAPTGTSVAVVGDHVVIGQADGDISKVQWCAFRDHTGWTDGTDQAGSQPMQTGGSVMGIAGGEYGIILQRERIVRMTRTGDASAPFQFDEISSNFGCAAGATIVQAGRTVFFRSDRGFMALDDGQVLKPIGSEKVDRTFDAIVARDDLELIFTAVDPRNKLVMWGIPGTPGQLWIYNFELDRWTTAQFAYRGIFPGFTTSVSMDALAGDYPDLDAMTISLDDPRWSGGNPRMYVIGSDLAVGTLSGATLAAQMDMGFSELAKGQRSRMRGVRPITDATDGVTIVVNAKQRLGDADNLKTASNLRSTGLIPVRASGRYMSQSLRHAAGSVWSYTQGLEVHYEVGGTR